MKQNVLLYACNRTMYNKLYILYFVYIEVLSYFCTKSNKTMPIYKFRIDTIHLPAEFDDMFDELQTVDVPITEKEAEDLIKAREEWFASEDFMNSDSADDE